MEKDRSPIDQRWIQTYCDEFMKVGDSLPEGLLKQAVIRRIECVMDLVEAWQKRNIPIDRR